MMLIMEKLTKNGSILFLFSKYLKTAFLILYNCTISLKKKNLDT